MKPLGEFEKQYRKQLGYWVSDFIVDALVPCVQIELVTNPDTMEKECTIEFIGTRNIQVSWLGEADESKVDYLCSLLGIDDYHASSGTRYVIATDVVEVSFITEEKPKVKWVDESKPFQRFSVKKLMK